jgi:quercetin dioxygenase-like cupin family protein
MSEYNWIENVSNLTGEVQPDSILSRTLYKNDHAKAVLFAFDAGQSLSEHRAGQPAIIHILDGEATLTIGDDTIEGRPGTLVDMQAGLKHTVYAKTRLVMLLFLLTKAHES